MIHQNLAVTVRIEPSKLIQALQLNKQNHLVEYQKAVEVWLMDLQTAYTTAISHASEKDMTFSYAVNLIQPINNEKLYDKYIGMFKLATDETLEITSEDYGCIVDDNWGWAISAAVSNSFYSSRHR